MKRIKLLTLLLCLTCFTGCIDDKKTQAASSSGVNKAKVVIKTGSDGLTTEQRNIFERLEEDNKPGAIKHLYVFSPYSGQALLYSTVKGKVTSSGKRISPKTVYAGSYGEYSLTGIGVEAGMTGEVLGDDGAYGDSDPYVYWWDTKGVYHQHYITGGQIIHVSSQPLNLKSVVLNLETSSASN